MENNTLLLVILVTGIALYYCGIFLLRKVKEWWKKFSQEINEIICIEFFISEDDIYNDLYREDIEDLGIDYEQEIYNELVHKK